MASKALSLTRLRAWPAAFNAAGFFGVVASRRLAAAAVLAVLSRSLPRDDLIAYATAWALSEIARAVLGFSAEKIAVRWIVENSRPQPQVRAAVAATKATLGAVAGVLLVAYLLITHASPMAVGVGITLVPYLIFSGIGEAFVAVLQAREQAAKAALASITTGASTMAALLCFAWLRSNPIAASAMVAVSEGLGCIALAAVAGRITATPGDVYRTARDVMRVSWPIGLASLLVAIYFRVDVSVLTRLHREDVAYYYLAYKLTEASLSFAYPIASALLPRLVITQAALSRQTVVSVRRVMDFTVAPMCVAVGLFTAFGDRLAHLMWGIDFARAAPTLSVLAVAAVFMSHNLISTNLLIALGLQSRLLALTAMLVPINLVSNLLLVPDLSLLGCALATLITEAANTAAQSVAVRRRGGANYMSWRSTAILLLALCGVAISGFTAHRLLVGLVELSIGGLASAVAAYQVMRRAGYTGD